MNVATNSINPFGQEDQQRGILRWLPGVRRLRKYQRGWFAKDLFAGMVLTAMLVPVGMGYAEACGLPPVTGLYASISGLLLYSLLGPSRLLVVGPDSALVAIIGPTILPLAASGSEQAAALAGMLAVLSGAICIVAGVLRFGFITDLLSTPIRQAYINAISLTLLVSQLPKLFGVKVVSGIGIIQTGGAFVDELSRNQTNYVSLAIGIGSLLTMLLARRYSRFPGILVAVLGSTVAVSALNLVDLYGVSVVGALPAGLPSLGLPNLTWHQIGLLVPGACAIALVSFADMSIITRAFAQRDSHKVDDNHELVALGVANIGVGLTQGFSITGSASRTPVVTAAGGETQLTNVIAAGSLIFLLLFGSHFLHSVPIASLAAVVTFAALSLIDLKGIGRLIKFRRQEFYAALACFLGVILLGVIQGIFLSVAIALLSFIWKAWRPYYAILGRVDDLKGYHDTVRHPEARLIPGLVLFRWDAPLFFANARIFRECVLQSIADTEIRVKRIVVTAEPVTDIDSTAADTLIILEKELRSEEIELCFAEMKGPVKDQLRIYGLFDKIQAEGFFPTIGSAVDAYVKAYNVNWQDWEKLKDQSDDELPSS